ncbi:MAG: response regulator [Deltaproteobacteria bacterium]|nr:response regulator [Deltaproteobacteria bacterium]MBW2154184.1 response regulator [Deltaproteobacteria bacterium]
MDKLKILLVDDEEEFATTLGERLGLRGVEAQIATNGESALEMIDISPPHVVVLDVRMPGMGGLEVLKHIKASHPQIPVILLTGHAATQDGIAGMRMGAYDYLIKPLAIDDLIKKIKEAVKTLST